MNPLSPLFFFELADDPLFKESQFAWEPLRNLKDFFTSQVLGEISIAIPDGVFLIYKEKISVGEGSIIEPGAYIEGPCIIGKHCLIRHGAYIRPYTLIKDHCVIGHASEIKHSILFPYAHASHFNYVGDSILGKEVNLGGGVICANLRLDRKEVKINGYKTDLKKLGAIIGDRAQVGCNSVLNPGTLLKKRALIRPCSNIYSKHFKNWHLGNSKVFAIRRS
jgi:NDP-sugar pyrophosphorylase family protein